MKYTPHQSPETLCAWLRDGRDELKKEGRVSLGSSRTDGVGGGSRAAKKNLDLCSCLSPEPHPGKCCQRTEPVTAGQGDPDPSCAQGAEPRAGTWPSQVTDLPSDARGKCSSGGREAEERPHTERLEPRRALAQTSGAGQHGPRQRPGSDTHASLASLQDQTAEEGRVQSCTAVSAEDLEPAVLPVGSILPGKLGDQGDRGEAASGVPGPGIGQSMCETHTFHGQVRKEATLGH